MRIPLSNKAGQQIKVEYRRGCMCTCPDTGCPVEEHEHMTLEDVLEYFLFGDEEENWGENDDKPRPPTCPLCGHIYLQTALLIPSELITPRKVLV